MKGAPFTRSHRLLILYRARLVPQRTHNCKPLQNKDLEFSTGRNDVT